MRLRMTFMPRWPVAVQREPGAMRCPLLTMASGCLLVVSRRKFVGWLVMLHHAIV